MNKLNTKKGFSLIELLVVIAIIGVLSAVGITAYTGYTASAKEQAARTQFAQMVSLVNAEAAKCSLGSGSYAWGDACSTAFSSTMATTIAAHMHEDLGMKNAYDNSEAGTTTFTSSGTATNPTDNGKTHISGNSTSIEIRTRVKTGSDGVLSQIIQDAS